MRNKNNKTHRPSKMKFQDVLDIFPEPGPKGSVSSDPSKDATKKGFRHTVNPAYKPPAPDILPREFQRAHLGNHKTAKGKRLAKSPSLIKRRSKPIAVPAFEKMRRNVAKAIAFAKQLVNIQAPIKTALLSLKASHGVNLSDARQIYNLARGRKSRRIRKSKI